MAWSVGLIRSLGDTGATTSHGGVRLVWDDKSAEVSRLRLPLQVVEVVNSPRADRGTIFEDVSAETSDGWRNQLIWGDHLHALVSLTETSPGQLDLVYFDPRSTAGRTTRSASPSATVRTAPTRTWPSCRR